MSKAGDELKELNAVGGSWEYDYRHRRLLGKLGTGIVWKQKNKNLRTELGHFAAKVDGHWIRWSFGELDRALVEHYREKWTEAVAENARLERALHDPAYGGQLLADMHGLAN